MNAWYGRILRATFIDEIPQLYNWLNGSMALVGPRPLEDYELSQMPADLRMARQEFKPGCINLWYASDKPLTIPNIMEIEWEFIEMAHVNYSRAQMYFGMKAVYHLVTLKQRSK